MKLETFFENFDLLSDAPNAVAKFRRLTLELAVRGMLVPQDPEDEPISELLERVQLEKRQLTRGKNSTGELPRVQQGEIFYEVPSSWRWIRLGEVINCLDHIRKPINKEERSLRSGRIPYYGANGQVGWIDEFLFDEPLVLVVEDETFIGRQLPFCYKVEGKSWVNNHAHVLQPTSGIDVDFLNYSLAYYPFTALTSGTTGRKKLTKSALLNVPYALPPLPEQKRIVEKCDRLMTLCDAIEQRQQEQQERLVTMNEGAIVQLLSAQNPDEFKQHWDNICNNFDLLYSIPETVPKLRQAILQLAVQGKLVRQEPGDEPVEVLLRDIQTKRMQLTKGGKLKKSKPLPSIGKDEIPYDLPESWTWIRLDELCSKITDGVHQTPNYTDSGVPFLSVTQLKDGQLNFDTARFISKEDHDLFYQRCDPQKGDVLLCKVGGTIGVTAVIEAEIEFSIFVQLALLKPIYVDSYYMKCVLLSDEVQNYIKDNSLGSAMPYISIGKLKNIKFPLPPLAEQKRIVAKVDRLMSLCDALEAKLQEARGYRETLVEVGTRQLLVA